MSQKSLKEKQEHEKFMQIAIYEANKAYQKNEVPIGALIIDLKNGKNPITAEVLEGLK